MLQLNNDLIPLRDEIRNIRRDLHKIPELGFQEYKTNEYIFKFLKELDIEVYNNVGKTGIVGFLKGSKGGKTIAFRADMDGLPICEETGVEYRSNKKGNMHACGHDGHMAILLGLAKYLSLNKNKILDNIVFIFQPAEEGPGGAEVIIDEGIIDRFSIDYIYGLHLYPDVDEGKIALKSGPMMAQTGEFDITIKGRSGHGAIPHNSIDSIVIAADLISSYQTIISRNISPIDPAVLTIGRIEGGERRNVIAGRVTMEGTLRAFKGSIYKKIKEKMIDIAKGFEVANGCNIDIVYRDMYPPVNNNKELVDNFINIIGEENIEIIEPQMTSEDFSYYQKKVPGLFFFLGVRNEKKGHVFSLHNSRFNFDDKILVQGIQIYLNLLKGNNALTD